jgi:outer membrane protein assembly factor BamB
MFPTKVTEPFALAGSGPVGKPANGYDYKPNVKFLAFWFAFLGLAPGASPALAQESILVASSTSHSIERFSPTGTWIGTFATTGPYEPVSLAQSPLTGEIFASTLSAPGGNFLATILQYQKSGQFSANWSTFTLPASEIPSTQSLLFDKSGNLWVATAYGFPVAQEGYPVTPISIYEYAAASLAAANPSPVFTITTYLYRGNQMAFDAKGNLCISSWADETVRCFNPSTGAQTFDYNAEILASGLSIQPAGLAFDASDQLYLPSTFAGQVAYETVPHVGPIALLGSGMTPELSFIALKGGNLYVPTYNTSAGFNPDTVYEVNASTGAVTSFITNHVWGAYQLIFAELTPLCPGS